MDVESLYTNMTLDRILLTVQQAFHENPNPFRPDDPILKLLSLTLYNNDFEFDGQFFLQLRAVAMGRKYAPSTANLYLKELDHAASYRYHIHPLLYSRLLDDIFGIWPGTLSKLLTFQKFLNTIIPGIKITITLRHQIIEFLDTRVYKHHSPDGSCSVYTKVFVKPTDAHRLLHRSFHPIHTFKSIVRSQFIRFKRISTTVQDFQQASSTLIKVLSTRSYSLPSLLKIKRHIWHNYQPSSPIPKPPTQLIPIVTFYDRHHSLSLIHISEPTRPY